MANMKYHKNSSSIIIFNVRETLKLLFFISFQLLSHYTFRILPKTEKGIEIREESIRNNPNSKLNSITG